MSVNEIYVDASPDEVFDVLSVPERYGDWVVGASRSNDGEGDWPEPGSTFEHVQGFLGMGWPDKTAVVSSNRPRTLVLEAHLRPFAVNKVELRLSPRGRGTKLVMVEYPIGGFAAKLPKPVVDVAYKLRNVESLRRLRRLAERGRTR